MDVPHVLRVALNAFAERGYDGVSMRELSLGLGLSHASVGMRFGSKEKLWFAAMEQAMLPARHAMEAIVADETLDDLERLRRSIVAHLEFAGANPQVLRIMSHEGAVRSPRLEYIYERFTLPARRHRERLLDRLAAAGRIAPVPYAAFHFLMTHGGGGLFTSAADSALLGVPDVRDPDVITAHAELVADLIVGGLTARVRTTPEETT